MRRIFLVSLFAGLTALLAGGVWLVTSARVGAQPPVGQPVGQSAPARLVVTVPADAEVEIEGSKTTTQKGAGVRKYQSPPLQPGVKYQYTVKATWKEGGKDKSLELNVNVRAGEESTVDFVKEAMKQPGKDKPVTDKPADKPSDKPKDKPLTDKPLTDKPVTDKPILDRPTLDKPVLDKPFTDKPALDKPKPDKPILDKPILDKPVLDKPVLDKPALDKPKPDKPALDKPVLDKPVLDKPALDE